MPVPPQIPAPYDRAPPCWLRLLLSRRSQHRRPPPPLRSLGRCRSGRPWLAVGLSKRQRLPPVSRACLRRASLLTCAYPLSPVAAARLSTEEAIATTVRSRRNMPRLAPAALKEQAELLERYGDDGDGVLDHLPRPADAPRFIVSDLAAGAAPPGGSPSGEDPGPGAGRPRWRGSESGPRDDDDEDDGGGGGWNLGSGSILADSPAEAAGAAADPRAAAAAAVAGGRRGSSRAASSRQQSTALPSAVRLRSRPPQPRLQPPLAGTSAAAVGGGGGGGDALELGVTARALGRPPGAPTVRPPSLPPASRRSAGGVGTAVRQPQQRAGASTSRQPPARTAALSPPMTSDPTASPHPLRSPSPMVIPGTTRAAARVAEPSWRGGGAATGDVVALVVGAAPAVASVVPPRAARARSTRAAPVRASPSVVQGGAGPLAVPRGEVRSRGG